MNIFGGISGGGLGGLSYAGLPDASTAPPVALSGWIGRSDATRLMQKRRAGSDDEGDEEEGEGEEDNDDAEGPEEGEEGEGEEEGDISGAEEEQELIRQAKQLSLNEYNASTTQQSSAPITLTPPTPFISTQIPTPAFAQAPASALFPAPLGLTQIPTPGAVPIPVPASAPVPAAAPLTALETAAQLVKELDASLDPEDDKDNFRSDQAFYSFDFSSGSAEQIGELLHQYEECIKAKFRLAPWGNYKRRPWIIGFVHGYSLQYVLAKSLPFGEEMKKIKVGGEPNRISHSCFCCQRPTAGEYRDLLCTQCMELNAKAKAATADLSGRYALVTGGRIRVGYSIALRLLRSGATVIITSRFPELAKLRYQGEKDYSEWSNRLFVFGLDLRHIPALLGFLAYVKKNFPVLDIIINNASMTVRRPPGYYDPLIKKEKEAFEKAKAANNNNNNNNQGDAAFQLPYSDVVTAFSSFANSSDVLRPGWSASLSTAPLLPPSIHSSKRIEEGRLSNDSELFSSDQFDSEGQPIDKRDITTWNSRLEQISVNEMMEAYTVNVVAPFTITNEMGPYMRTPSYAIIDLPKEDEQEQGGEKQEGDNNNTTEDKELLLKQLPKTIISDPSSQTANIYDPSSVKEAERRAEFERSLEGKTERQKQRAEFRYNYSSKQIISKSNNTIISNDNLIGEYSVPHRLRHRRYIINVVSSEGQFNTKYKRSWHPHTNMSKAAINMMTRSCAEDYAKDFIYMLSIDPGYISDIRPYSVTLGRPIKMPLTPEDGAARILFPIFNSIRPDGPNFPKYGVYLKNFQEEDW